MQGLRMTVAALVLCAVGTMAVTAQQPATFVMRDGERVRGALVDMGAEWTVRIDGEDRRVPIPEIVLIDFAGDGRNLPDAEVAEIPGFGQLVVMRDGTTVLGELIDVTGSPVVFQFRTTDGERRIRLTDIRRFYRTEAAAVVAAAPAARDTARTAERIPERTANRAPDRNMRVLAQVRWTQTGLRVSEGEYVRFTADGRVQLSASADDLAGPAGSLQGRRVENGQLADTLAGALVGIVGGTPFGIGDQTEPLRMPATGQLSLGVNDDVHDDNSGNFMVTVTKVSPPRR